MPTGEKWRHLAKLYGGVSMDSDDKGKDAYKALLTGGSSGFNAILGGGRSYDDQYARLEAHETESILGSLHPRVIYPKCQAQRMRSLSATPCAFLITYLQCITPRNAQRVS